MRLLVRFADGARDRALARHRLLSRGVVAGTPFERAEITTPSAEEELARLAADPDVLEAEVDERMSLDFTPNDLYYLSDPYTGLGQWGLRRAQVDRAWDSVRGSPIMTVAVIDTGVDPAHPDLVAALVPAPKFLRFADPTCPPSTTNRDDNGHGAHVAGIIGAIANNGTGVAGVAFGVRIMPIKALDCTGEGFSSDVASAITYAADHGARVVNVSLGSPNASSTVQSAVSYALSRNVVVVAAAGNCGSRSGTSQCPTQNTPSYPAAYPGVLAVGATDTTDAPASFSTAGSYVGIAAPGTRIISTLPTYGVPLNDNSVTAYGSLTGTSQASPFVAGVAALVLSQSPGLSGSAVVQRLRDTADDVYTTGFDTKTGSGRVNALRAVSATTSAPTAPSPSTVEPGAGFAATYQPQASSIALTSPGPALNFLVAVGNSGTRTWPAGGAQPVRLSYHWREAGSGRVVVWDGNRGPFAQDVAPGAAATVQLSVAPPPAPGAYTLELDLVQEGVNWFSEIGVPTRQIAAVVTNGYAATYTVDPVPPLLPGVRARVRAVVANTGGFTWTAAGATPVRLSYHLLDAFQSVALWDGARTALSADLLPGGSATLSYAVDAPAIAGTYLLRADLVREGVAWFSTQGVFSAQSPLLVFEDRRATTTYAAATVSRSAPQPLTVAVKNTSGVAFGSEGPAPVNVASHWLAADGSVLLWDGPRAALPRLVLPGEEVSLRVPLAGPPPGATHLVIDLVHEGNAWFGAGAARPVTFIP